VPIYSRDCVPEQWRSIAERREAAKQTEQLKHNVPTESDPPSHPSSRTGCVAGPCHVPPGAATALQSPRGRRKTTGTPYYDCTPTTQHRAPCGRVEGAQNFVWRRGAKLRVCCLLCFSLVKILTRFTPLKLRCTTALSNPS